MKVGFKIIDLGYGDGAGTGMGLSHIMADRTNEIAVEWCEIWRR